MSAVRILVADDHEVVRSGLRLLLERQPGWQVCAEAVNGREAVEKANQLKPDVIVLDISMPVLNGLEATRQICKALPLAEVLVLTMHESEQLVRELLDAGAHGYLSKSEAGRQVVAAVEALSQHKLFFIGKVAKVMLNGYLEGGARRDRDEPPHDSLTPREREIVQLLAEGKSNKEVAVTLNVAVKTAETHRTNIMRKLELHSLADLIHYAIRNKIVEP